MVKKKIKKRQDIRLIESFDRRGYLQSIRNPKGKKPHLQIVQKAVGRRGFTARTLQGKTISFSKKAEIMARRLAKKGHKKITFLD